MSIPMNAILVEKGFAKDAGRFFTKAGLLVRDGAVWCGKAIKVLVTDFLVPGMKAIWPYFVSALAFGWSLIQTPIGLGASAFAICGGAGYAILAYANVKDKDPDTSKVTLVMLRVIAGSCFLAAGVAVAAGVALTIA